MAPDVTAVSEVTYLPLTSGVFCYALFVIDAFAGVITGLKCSLSKVVYLVSGALRNAGEYRRREGHPPTETKRLTEEPFRKSSHMGPSNTGRSARTVCGSSTGLPGWPQPRNRRGCWSFTRSWWTSRKGSFRS